MIVVKNTQAKQAAVLEKDIKEHLQSFKYNNQNSKFAQHATETGHEFGKRNDIMPTEFFGKKRKTPRYHRKILHLSRHQK
jgi:hypothetical protein